MIANLFMVIAALAASEADPVKAVICAETAFSRAAERRDEAAFIALVDPDARFVGASVSRGHAEIRAAWSFAFSEGGSTMRWRPAIVEVTSDGQLAISLGPYRLSGTDGEGAAVEVWGTFISTWRKNADGMWRVVFDTSGESNMQPSDADIEVLRSEPDCP